jgi:predicted metal-binding transcription factor (methanogenesis marker protein 9)
VDAAIEEAVRSAELYKAKIDRLLRLAEIKSKRLNGERLSWSDVVEAQKVTCFGSIAHCCKYTKECPNFFAACDALGLDPKEVSEFKEKVIVEFLEKRLLS